MNNEIPLSVADIGDLLADAYELIEHFAADPDEPYQPKIQDWLTRCSDYGSLLNGRRKSLREKIASAIADASEVRAVGINETQLTEEEVVKRLSALADNLLCAIDDYADLLPVVRPASLIELDENDPVESLAKVIYQLTSNEPWDEAPKDIAQALRSTANQLPEILKRLKFPLQTIEIDSEGGPTAKQREEIERIPTEKFGPPTPENDNVEVTADPGFIDTGTGLPPNIPMPPGFHSDSEKPL